MDYVKTCLGCSASFTTQTKQKRYCSRSCSEKSRWPKKRERENERRKKRYISHKQQEAESRRKYYLEHKEHLNECVRNWQIANPEKFAEYMKKAKSKYVENLQDHYIKDLLRKHHKEIKPETISTDIIAMKREQLMIYRSVKQLIQTIKEKQND